MFNKWANHPMNSRGRDNLKETDKFWEEVYSKNKNLRFPEGKLLYRVHTGGYKKPVNKCLSYYDLSLGARVQQSPLLSLEEEK
ncbi:hypothetical protein NE279_13265 [Enterococcus faecium]|uniref:hypothetical protein n=1 Tax=Enterococcus faecium TaxID=1352 RepID=UPI002073E69E|nr:hypothetical protein [Enterococcus faecium]MCM6924448.1 hypothetical protein [Enterococcus faecium]